MRIICYIATLKPLFTSLYKRLFLVLKVVITVLAVWVIYDRVSGQWQQEAFHQVMNAKLQVSFYWLLAVQVVLMLLNIWLEGLRWRSLVYHLEPVSKLTAFKAVFAGTPVGIFTPNRIGDIGGRLFFLHPRFRLRGIAVSLVGAFAHSIVIFLFGLFALVGFCYQYLQLEGSFLYVLLYLVLLLLGLLLLLFFNVAWLSKLADSIAKYERLHKLLEVLGSYSRLELGSLLLLSICRFLIYTGQYAWLMYYMVDGIDFWNCLHLTYVIFLVQAIVPSFVMTDLGIRGATSVYFMSYITPLTMPVLTASFILWSVNVMLPALIGLTFVIKQKYLDDSGADN